jgi:hypothetical protein
MGELVRGALDELPAEILALIVDKLEAADAVRLVEMTSRRVRAELDVLALWRRLARDIGLPFAQAGGDASFDLVGFKRVYSRHFLHARGACARCGSRVRGRSKSTVDSAPLDSDRYMHLCDWLKSAPRASSSSEASPDGQSPSAPCSLTPAVLVD